MLAKLGSVPYYKLVLFIFYKSSYIQNLNQNIDIRTCTKYPKQRFYHNHFSGYICLYKTSVWLTGCRKHREEYYLVLRSFLIRNGITKVNIKPNKYNHK